MSLTLPLANMLKLAKIARDPGNIVMLRVYACLTSEHDPAMLFLAAAICIVSCLTASLLAIQVRDMAAPRRRWWILLLAAVTGTGIWATHFVAMLAYRPGLPTVFLALPTIASMAIAIAATWAAWTVLLGSGRQRSLLAGAGFALGILAMHFTGMAALKTVGRFDYDWALAGGAAIAGLFLSVASARLFMAERAIRAYGAGTLLAAAICMLHFGSMAAVTIRVDPSVALPPASMDAELLTVIVAMGVVALMGIVLATAIYEARGARTAAEETGRLKNFTQSALEGLAILEGDRIVDANETFWCIAGYDPADPPRDLPVSAVLPEHAERPSRALGPAFFEARLLGTDGSFLEVETAVRKLAIGGAAREAVIVRDISERKAAAARIAHMAAHDPLTGAGNRIAFSQTLEAALCAAGITSPVAMLCLDLDRFKAINDLHGHPVGDAALVEAARRIQRCLGEDEFLARLGGDEFAVVQRRGPQPASAGQLAGKIVKAMEAPVAVGELAIHLGASIGIAVFPTNARDAEDLHTKADLALYRAKSEGRGNFRFFDGAMDVQLLQRRRLESDLRTAVEEDQFHLHYQPFSCLETSAVTGFEALVRWTHPELGAISPAEFIPLAEENGLIPRVGDLVLARACAEASRWTKPLRIAVNVSPAQLVHGDMLATVKDILARTGLAADRLDLEVTEGVLLQNSAKAVETLRALQALGVSIALDDFGTGYSALGYFRTFPFDKVKIDRSFVAGLPHSREALAIVKAIIGLGRGLGMAIIAEGVETRDQLALLHAEGCHKVQGYLVGRPGPIEKFEHLVEGRGHTSHPCPIRCDTCGETAHRRARYIGLQTV